MVDSTDSIAECFKMQVKCHNFTTLFSTKTLHVNSPQIHSLHHFDIELNCLHGRISILLLKSPSVLDALQIVLEVMMGHFVFSIISSWKPKASVFALFAFLLVPHCKSFTSGDQQISQTIKKKLCGVYIRQNMSNHKKILKKTNWIINLRMPIIGQKVIFS